MKIFLGERLTFDQLFRYSEPKRVKRADTVRGPPLEIDANSDAVYHSFNFKSFPSTTGLRHRGYIKFYRPKNKNPNNVPLQHIPCEVDCTCPDFRYRWAWANKQRGSSRVGLNSLNQALNRAPRITNPANIPGLCKHILAARDYIYGLLSKFPKGEPDTAEKLVKMFQYGINRWADFPGLSANAKEREAWFKAARDARNRGEPIPPGPPTRYIPAAPKTGVEPEAAESPELPAEEVPVAPRGGPVLPRAGRPQATPASAPLRRRRRGEAPVPVGSAKYAQQATKAGFPTAAEFQATRKVGESLGVFLPTSVNKIAANRSGEGAIRKTEQRMNSLNEAQKIVEELEHDELEHEGAPEEMAADALPPSETPIDDEAVGADTEGNVVLTLLSDIRDLLARLVGEEAEEHEGEEGLEGEAEAEGEAVDAIPETPEEEEEEMSAPGARPSSMA